jgi:hypothetical protein
MEGQARTLLASAARRSGTSRPEEANCFGAAQLTIEADERLVSGPPAEPAKSAQDGRRHAACRRSSVYLLLLSRQAARRVRLGT